MPDTRDRHNGVLIEHLKSKIETVAEGVVAVNEKLDRFVQETDARFQETHVLIKDTGRALRDRIEKVERRQKGFDGRLGKLEAARV